jgi:hypothetical protein
MHLHILQCYAHQLFLLLHRPFFAPSPGDLAQPNESQVRSVASAEALLDIHRLLVGEARFGAFLWYTRGIGSFHALHAAVVLAVALLMPIYGRQWERFRGAIGICRARMEALAPRSVVCGRAGRVLDALL